MKHALIEERYEQQDRAGDGSHGVVYLARDKQTGKGVAVKQLKRRTVDGHMARLAKREEYILRACQASPHVVQLVEVVRGARGANGEGIIFIVMEQAQHDLRGLIENKAVSSRWTRSHVKGYCWQLLQAVAFVHSCGFMHRDLKPANVLVSRGNVLKLADFGNATSVEGDELEAKGHFMNPVATLWYRAPEVLLGARDYGAAIDVWAVGCILGDMLQNSVFFPGTTDEEQLQCINALCEPEQRDMQRVLGRDNKLVARKHFFTPMAIALLDALLTLDPAARPTASHALDHGYFDAAQDGGIEVMPAELMIRHNEKSNFARAK